MVNNFPVLTRRTPPRVWLPIGALVLALLAGCQPKVYLMPTPEGLRSGQHDPFETDSPDAGSTRVQLPYVTNRLPAGKTDNRTYLTFFDQNLRFGVAAIRIGDPSLTPAELRGQSTTGKREQPLLLRLENADELAVEPPGKASAGLTPNGAEFFRILNEALAASADKDLIVYLHGANSNFYRAAAQAAQFRHFTGRNSVVLLFAWPSAESLLGYAVDVRNAQKTVPVFARFLELLAAHSNAENIDILAYSAGAQILSPALAELRQRYAENSAEDLHQRLRLGEIYFAAPDVDFNVFLKNLATYIDLPRHVTLTVNPSDKVLSYAAAHHGVSRAGRPDPDDLSEEETRWVIEASQKLPFDILWITPESIPDLPKSSHNFWYDNPWVSTDLLVLLLFQARPAERGLEPYEGEKGGKIWYFPPDYPQRVDAAITRFVAMHRGANR